MNWCSRIEIVHSVNNALAENCNAFTVDAAAAAAAVTATTVATFIYVHVIYHTNQMHLNRILTFCSLPLPLHCRYIWRIHIYVLCRAHTHTQYSGRTIALISISMMLCIALTYNKSKGNQMRNNFHYSALNCSECCTLASIQSIRMHNQEVLHDAWLLLLMQFFWFRTEINWKWFC